MRISILEGYSVGVVLRFVALGPPLHFVSADDNEFRRPTARSSSSLHIALRRRPLCGRPGESAEDGLPLARLVVVDDLLIGGEVEEGFSLDDRAIFHPKDPDELVAVGRSRCRGG